MCIVIGGGSSWYRNVQSQQRTDVCVLKSSLTQYSIPVVCVLPVTVATTSCQHWRCTGRGVPCGRVYLLGVYLPGTPPLLSSPGIPPWYTQPPGIPTSDIPTPERDLIPGIHIPHVNRPTQVKTLPSRNLIGRR